MVQWVWVIVARTGNYSFVLDASLNLTEVSDAVARVYFFGRSCPFGGPVLWDCVVTWGWDVLSDFDCIFHEMLFFIFA